MRCEECSELLTEYIDGRLPVEDSAEVAAHIESCGRCRKLEAELKATVGLLEGLPRQAPPADMAERVAMRLERRMLLEAPQRGGAGRILTTWRMAAIGTAAAAMLLAVLCVHLTQPNPAFQREVDDSALKAGDDLDDLGAYAPQAASAPAGHGLIAPAPAVAAAQEGKVGEKDEKERTRFAYVPTDTPKDLEMKMGKPVAAAEPAAETRAVPSSEAAFGVSREALRESATAVSKREAKPDAGQPAEELERMKSLGYIAGESPQATPPGGAGGRRGALEVAAPATEVAGRAFEDKALVANGVVAALAFGRYMQVDGTVLALKFKGKVTSAAMAFLKLLPEGKAPLPEGDISLEELKKAAEGRGVSVVELTVDEAVFDVKAAPEEAAKWEKGTGLQAVRGGDYAEVVTDAAQPKAGGVEVRNRGAEDSKTEGGAMKAVTNRVIFVRDTGQK